MTGLISVLVISVFISFGSMRDEAARLTAEGPRRKWSFLSRTYRWAYRKVWGQEPDNTTYVTNYLDPRGAEALAAVERDRGAHYPRGARGSSPSQSAGSVCMNIQNMDFMQIIHWPGASCALGLAMFFFNINLGIQAFAHPGIEAAAAGWLMKAL